ncbi:protein ATP1B4 isoform X1 [Ascaphus truei]|uniref:protein ATP1B4 isoform X1 n=2 Tax=Ascaphus truei TaxID=8439 RepID=UPI003F59D59C
MGRSTSDIKVTLGKGDPAPKSLQSNCMEMKSRTQRSADQQNNDLHLPDNRNDERGQHSDETGEESQMEHKKTCAECIRGFKLFIWNPEKREFMGRNAKSWGQILLFYLVLYAFLTGMFALCMYGLLLTISPYVPTERDRVYPPGVSIRPHVSGFDFTFSASDRSTWSSYVDNMHEFLKAYNDDAQRANNVACTPGEYFFQAGELHEEKKACRFPRSQLQNCSGIEDPTFGFSEGKPCFLLKMNRILGYEAGWGVPIYVTCAVQKGDETDLGPVTFYPKTGHFDLMYFPYYGKLTHVNYTSPLIAMHFTEVRRNHPVTVQCKINGEGIISDSKTDRFLGRITFTVNIGG